eukprot:scaffold34484_cov63-Phaeocystis_antarctica.AAC.8
MHWPGLMKPATHTCIIEYGPTQAAVCDRCVWEVVHTVHVEVGPRKDCVNVSRRPRHLDAVHRGELPGDLEETASAQIIQA